MVAILYVIADNAAGAHFLILKIKLHRANDYMTGQ